MTRGLRAQTTHSFDDEQLPTTDHVPGLAQGARDSAVGKKHQETPNSSAGVEPRHLKLRVSKTQLTISRPPPLTAPKPQTPSVFSISAPTPGG